MTKKEYLLYLKLKKSGEKIKDIARIFKYSNYRSFARAVQVFEQKHGVDFQEKQRIQDKIENKQAINKAANLVASSINKDDIIKQTALVLANDIEDAIEQIARKIAESISVEHLEEKDKLIFLSNIYKSKIDGVVKTSLKSSFDKLDSKSFSKIINSNKE